MCNISIPINHRRYCRSFSTGYLYLRVFSMVQRGWLLKHVLREKKQSHKFCPGFQGTEAIKTNTLTQKGYLSGSVELYGLKYTSLQMQCANTASTPFLLQTHDCCGTSQYSVATATPHTATVAIVTKLQTDKHRWEGPATHFTRLHFHITTRTGSMVMMSRIHTLDPERRQIMEVEMSHGGVRKIYMEEKSEIDTQGTWPQCVFY